MVRLGARWTIPLHRPASSRVIGPAGYPAWACPSNSTGGLRVIPDATLETCPPLDILVVPGGWGTRKEIGNPRVLTWIAERAKEVETFTSVCTGAMLLGQAGLLDGRRATTHWRSLDWMRQSFPAVTVEDTLHVVEDGQVLTSAGISAGIDMALLVVARATGSTSFRLASRRRPRSSTSTVATGR